MSIENVVMLLGGLALFLYGMQVMCRGLEVAAGDRLRSILEKLTSNRLLGVLVGAGITAIIQSSSATTVMVVGFVNSGLMTLTQAVGVIMGANIGTTVTGLLIALDIGLIAPLFAFCGVLVVMMSKKQRVICVGEIVAGLGILFIGMELMSSSMAPLRDYEPFANMMASFKNPILGILAGALFTALIQSSSASIGILQGLAMSGVGLFESYQAIGQLLALGAIDSGTYYGNLAMVYVFMLVGAIPMLWSALRSSKVAARVCRLGDSNSSAAQL